MPDSTLEKLLSTENKDWLEETKNVKLFFKKFKRDLPRELWEELEALISRLK